MRDKAGSRRLRQNERPILGFLTPGLQVDSKFHKIWVGVVDAAREQNVNLICFCVGPVSSETKMKENSHKVLLDLITPERIDGLITLESWAPEEFKRVCARYRPLPILSLMQEVEGYYSVSLNYHDVTRVKLQHLVEVHGYRRIAYIRGPETSWSAQTEYQVFLDVMTEYGLPLDPTLVIPYTTNANYSRDVDSLFEDGQEAIRILLDERQVRPGRDCEVILCYNDQLARGVIEALQRRGIRVPYDVALMGSGGQEEARLSKPPVTTTAPPYYEIGQKAVEVLLAMLVGEPVAERTTVPLGLHVRRSCGCLDPSLTRAAADTVRGSGESFESLVTAQREKTLSAMEQATGGPWQRLEGWAGRLLDAFVTEVRSTGKTDAGESLVTGFIQTGFIQTLEDILYQVDRLGGDVNMGHDVLSALHAQTLPCLSHDVDLWGRANNLWQQGRVLVHNICQEAEICRQTQKDRQAMILREIGQQLMSTFDVAGLMDMLAKGLPRLEIPGCYLSLYENPAVSLEAARLMLAYNEQGRVDLGSKGQRFRSSQLVPAGILPNDRCFNLIVESLHFGKEQIGLVVFEVNPREDRMIYDTLRGEISRMLKGALLLEQHVQTEEELAHFNRELERSNRELEQFAYVASHDLQEPLRMVTSYLQLLERRYKGDLDEDANDFITFAVDGAKRMQTMISALLAYSRVGTRGKPFEPADVSAILHNALDNLAVAIEENGAVITHDNLPIVMADDVQLTQLLQNLISNAIKFRQQNIHPEIHVGAKHADGEWVFLVRDNGIGIDPQYFEHLFQIFKRLHSRAEYEGAGIGLAMCQKIVERHGGRIWVESEPGEGSTFHFTIPDREEQVS